MRTNSHYYFCAFLMNGILAVCAIGLPLYLQKRFFADTSEIAFVTAMGTVGYTIGCPLLGHLSELVGRRRMMIAGCLLFAMVYFLVLRGTQLYQIFILASFSGVSQAMFWPALEAEIAHGSGSTGLVRGIGLFNLSWCSGMAIGAQVGGSLYDVDPRLPLQTAFVALPIALLIALPWAGREAPESRSEPESQNNLMPKASTRNEFMYLAWMANFATFCTISVARSLFAQDVRARLGFSGTLAGAIVATAGFTQVAAFFLLMQTKRWHYRLRYLFAVPLMLGLGAILTFCCTEKVILFAAFGMIGLAAGMSYFSSLYYSLHGQERKGGKAGLHELVVGLGLLAGPLLGGTLARLTQDSRSPYLVCTVVAFSLLAAQLIHLRRRGLAPAE